MTDDMEIDLDGGEKPSGQSVAPSEEQIDEHVRETGHSFADVMADANDLESSRALMFRSLADLIDSARPAVKGISSLVPFAKKYFEAEAEAMIAKLFKKMEVQLEYKILEVLVKGGLVEPEILTAFTQQANLSQRKATGSGEIDVGAKVLGEIGLDTAIG